MKLLKINWSALTIAQSILLSVGVLALAALLLFGKRLGIDGDYIRGIGVAGVAVLTAGGFLSNQSKDPS
jgi:hypothetical protein